MIALLTIVNVFYVFLISLIPTKVAIFIETFTGENIINQE